MNISEGVIVGKLSRRLQSVESTLCLSGRSVHENAVWSVAVWFYCDILGTTIIVPIRSQNLLPISPSPQGNTQKYFASIW